MDRLWTQAQVAAWLGMSVRSVRRKRVPCVRDGQWVRYIPAQVMAWAEARGLRRRRAA